MPKANLTNQFIEKLPFTKNGQIFYWDTQLKRFGIRIGVSSKSFVCEKKTNFKTTRVTIGNFPDYSVYDARKKAAAILSQLNEGVDPNKRKKNIRTRTITLEGVYSDYINSRTLTANTLKEYSTALRLGFPDWCNKEMRSIDKDMVEERHIDITKNRGKAQANKFARTLRALFNFAIAKYELDGQPLITVNPVIRISETRSWNTVRRRRGHLEKSHLIEWFKSVDRLDNTVIRDYLKVILLTGARRNEIATLRWDNVNIDTRTFRVIDPKNHIDMELPMSTQIFHIIKKREFCKDSPFVFPSRLSMSGHIEEPRKSYERVSREINHTFTLHDLRRTFITFAESLDVPYYALKALVNHKMSESDVTAGYVIHSAERLREPMQKISDYIMEGVYES